MLVLPIQLGLVVLLPIQNDYLLMIDYLFVKIKEGLENHEVRFRDIVSLFQHDELKYDEDPCEQCGDTVSTTTWNI